MKLERRPPKNFWVLAAIIFLLLVLLTLTTKSFGATDIGSFTSPAKYFAGSYQAKIRSSHSYLWGLVNAPFVKIFQSFIGFKLLSLIVLALIALSVYFISGKDKRVFFLMLVSPVVWYMAPWINSIQISSLFFLWCYFFMQKYEEVNKIKNLFYSGIFFGLAAAFWHAIFFFGIFFIIIFLYNKKVWHLFYYLIFILIGLIPIFILDYFLFGFPFHTLMKNVMGTVSNLFALGVYSDIRASPKTPIRLISLFLVIPIYFWMLYKRKNFKQNPKTILFLTSSLLIIFKNPQIRYLLLIVPIMLLNLNKILDNKQVKKLLIFSVIISLLVVIPYEIQIKYPSTNGPEFTSLLENLFNLELSKDNTKEVVNEDLIQISEEYPNQIFLVGNNPDDYQFLADIYWEKNIREFVSMQDYYLFLKNSSILVEREFRSPPKSEDKRREIWIKGGIGKPFEDPTNYASIEYAISLEEHLKAENFELVKKYKTLYLYRQV